MILQKICDEISNRIKRISFGAVSVTVTIHGGRVVGIEYQTSEKVRITTSSQDEKKGARND
ncbi:DUF2292 domain-containing protein [Treponema saccharophilum]|uniref:DUF2292 domain-containing protein n=1 Tax=Treponema saccharophilum TaxID=165 RepID=UPI0002F8D4E8|nr:DUF2292 domain-containing protein [Treponema saccharophilum]